MALAALEQLLQASMGLSVASIGSAAIARAVRERLSVCKIGNLHAYLERVRASDTELQALIEEVVVPETWFFRDRHAFTSLARFAQQEWLPAHPEGIMSVLSLPCSTGEEPYSIAMALLDAGVAVNRFRVDAVDISARNIVQATRGVYGRNSFRGDELGFRDRHFDVTPEGCRVRDTVRRHVRFQPGNLFAPDFLPGVAIYDAIFCRNVLIYFDRPTQDRTLVVLLRLLDPRGLLFVAPSETALPTSHEMVSTNEPLAFAFRKVGAVLSAPKRKPPQPVKPLAPRSRVAPPSRVRVAPPTGDGLISALPAADARPDLRDAARLADQGHFVEAAAICEEYLHRSGPSAIAFYLLGLVRDATGNPSQALACYRKALYLDPNHHETQVHLALLMEKRGDLAGAQVLRNRTRRLEQKGKVSDGSRS